MYLPLVYSDTDQGELGQICFIICYEKFFIWSIVKFLPNIFNAGGTMPFLLPLPWIHPYYWSTFLVPLRITSVFRWYGSYDWIDCLVPLKKNLIAYPASHTSLQFIVAVSAKSSLRQCLWDIFLPCVGSSSMNLFVLESVTHALSQGRNRFLLYFSLLCAQKVVTHLIQ